MSTSMQRAGAMDGDAVVLAFMIADIRSYSWFSSEHGDVAAAALAKRFADLARDAVEARNGTVVELRGDEALAAFPTAAQSVQAAVELQLSCVEESERDPSLPLLVGVGIDMGPAVPVEDGYRGIAINLAARLCSSAGAGQVLLTATVEEQSKSVRDEVELNPHGSSTFKGFAQPVTIVEARARVEPVLFDDTLTSGSPLPPELVDATPLIGRTHEMRWLRGTWRQVRRGHGRVLAIDGPSGIGKTRLAAAIAAHVLGFGGVTRYSGPGGLAAATALSAVSEARSAQTPSLIVIDQLDVVGPEVIAAIEDALADIAGLPVLVLLLLREAATSSSLAGLVERCAATSGHRHLAPLSPAEVADIVALYASGSAEDAPVEMIVRASRGIPSLIHERASDWARSETTRRLEAAAGFMAAARERRTADLEFANNVIGLKLGRLYAPGGTPPPPDIEELGPYKGLASFDQEDAAWFFGREQVVGELAARIVASGALAILGASGSGKSSVVAAGLLPSLRAGLLPGSSRWRQAEMRPGDQPMAALRAALASHDDDPIAVAIDQLDDDSRLVLVVDQFEEVFIACDSETERTEFLEMLARHSAQDFDRFAVVVVLRSDFYGQLAGYPALAGLLADNHVLVGPLTRAELHRVVQLPAERAGVRIESALVETLVDEAAGEPGALPLLSTALVELWQARTGGWIRGAAYHERGGIRGAVARLADASFAQLDEVDQGAARRVLLRLASSAEGDLDTRRRVELDEFDLARDVSARRVIDQFTTDRLLTVSGSTIEVAHEALLREWPRLRSWLEEDVHGRQLRQHLTLAASGWHTAGREPSELYRGARLNAVLEWARNHSADLNDLERAYLNASREASEAEADKTRRSNRRLRRIATALAAVVLLAVAGGVIALYERSTAQTEAKHAKQAANQANQAANRAEQAALVADARRLATLSLSTPDLATSALLAAASYRLKDSSDSRGALLSVLERGQSVSWRVGTKQGVDGLAATSDGSRVYAFGGGRLEVIDSARHAVTTDYQTNAQTENLIGATDRGAQLVVHGLFPDERLRVLDAATGRVIKTLPGTISDAYDAPSVSPDGRWLVAGGVAAGEGTSPGSLAVYDSTDWSLPRRVHRFPKKMIQVAVSNHGVLAETADKTVYLVDPATLQVLAHKRRPDMPNQKQASLFGIANGQFVPDQVFSLSPDGRHLAYLSPTDRSTPLLLDTAHLGSPAVRLPTQSHAVTSMRFSPDDAQLSVSSLSGSVNVYSVRDGSLQLALAGQSGAVTAAVWASSTAGARLYTGGLDNQVVSWNLARDSRLVNLRGSPVPGAYLATQVGDHVLAVGPPSPTAHLYDLDLSTAELRLWPAQLRPRDGIISLSETADHSLAMTSIQLVAGPPPYRSRWQLWDLPNEQLLANIPLPSGSDPTHYRDAVLSPDGRTAVVATRNARIAVISLPSGHVLRSFPVRLNNPGRSDRLIVAPYAFAPSGQLLIAVRDQGAANGASQTNHRMGLVDVARGELVAQASLAGGEVDAVAWSSKGKLLAVGTTDGTLLLYDARTLKLIGQPAAAQAGSVDAVSFSPDDRTIITSGTDAAMNVWNVATLTQEGPSITFPHAAGYWFAWYAPNGDVTGLAPTGTVHDESLSQPFVFPGRASEWLRQACALAGSDFTPAQWAQYVGDRPYQHVCQP